MREWLNKAPKLHTEDTRKGMGNMVNKGGAKMGHLGEKHKIIMSSNFKSLENIRRFNSVFFVGGNFYLHLGSSRFLVHWQISNV